MPPVPLPDTRPIMLTGFTITTAHLEFGGLCDECAAILTA
jgi:hypothetical protein